MPSPTAVRLLSWHGALSHPQREVRARVRGADTLGPEGARGYSEVRDGRDELVAPQQREQRTERENKREFSKCVRAARWRAAGRPVGVPVLALRGVLRWEETVSECGVGLRE